MRRQLGARHRRKTFRHRSRLRARTQPRGAQFIFRGTNVPDRPLSRQRDCAKYSRLAIRQRDFRAALERALPRPRPDYRIGNARRGRTRRLLRRRGRAARYGAKPFTSIALPHRDGTADRSERRQYSRRESESRAFAPAHDERRCRHQRPARTVRGRRDQR